MPDDVELQLRNALEELTNSTPLANPLGPRTGEASLGGDRGNGPWRDTKVLTLLVGAVIVIAVVIGVGVAHLSTHPSHQAATSSTTTSVPNGRSVTVPALVGLTQVEAGSTLGAIGLNVGYVSTDPSAQYPPGIVISQSPPSDTSVAPGSSVSLVVSSRLSGGQSPSTSLPNSANCHSGTVSFNTATETGPVCLNAGSVLMVAFTLPGVHHYGSWSTALANSDAAVLTQESVKASGPVLNARFVAAGPGTTQVVAYFDQTCAPSDATPCTIPPQLPVSVTVTVAPTV
jgi:hypothetical protein